MYIKTDNKDDVFANSEKKVLKQWILFFISVFFIVMMFLKSIDTNTHLVPVVYSNAYQLLTKILFFVVIVQQVIIAWFKKDQFWSTIFQQISTFIFSYNIHTLAVMYFQNTVLRQQHNWIYSNLLILFELFILIAILAAWEKIK